MFSQTGGLLPAAPEFTLPNTLDELRIVANVVLDDWNKDRRLNPVIRDAMAQQYWRASLSDRLFNDNIIGASYIAFAACIGTDILATSVQCAQYLQNEPVGLMCTPEDGQRLILELYAVIHADGKLSTFLDHYQGPMISSCFGLGCHVAERIGVKDSNDPILRSIDLHTRIIAAALAIDGMT